MENRKVQGKAAYLQWHEWTCEVILPNLQITHWPKDDYGKFFNGDSYIILNTYKKPESDVSDWTKCCVEQACSINLGGQGAT